MERRWAVWMVLRRTDWEGNGGGRISLKRKISVSNASGKCYIVTFTTIFSIITIYMEKTIADIAKCKNGGVYVMLKVENCSKLADIKIA